MARDFSQLKRGSLELLVLFLLSEDDMYGYQITQEINERSEGLFPMQEGSLYPVLYRLIKDKSISSFNQLHNGRNRVYYHIEKNGLELLSVMKQEYDSISLGVTKVFESGKRSDEK